MDDSDDEMAGYELHANLSSNSVHAYTKSLLKFEKWKDENNINSNSEATLLMYFKEMSIKYVASTLWLHFSMLKSTLLANENINIGDYQKLKDFINLQTKQNQTLPTCVLSEKQIETFFNSAPDDTYLVEKAILIVQICGKCRQSELNVLTIKDVELKKDVAVITINRFKYCVARKFIIVDPYLEIFSKYVEKRMEIEGILKFFLKFESGKCLNRPLGKDFIQKTHRVIAKYLNLPNHENYRQEGYKRMQNNIPLNVIRKTDTVRTVNINMIDSEPKSMTYTQNRTVLYADVKTCNESQCNIPNIRMKNCRNVSFNFSK